MGGWTSYFDVLVLLDEIFHPPPSCQAPKTLQFQSSASNFVQTSDEWPALTSRYGSDVVPAENTGKGVIKFYQKIVQGISTKLWGTWRAKHDKPLILYTYGNPLVHLAFPLIGATHFPLLRCHGATFHGGNDLENGFMQHIQAGCLQRFISKDETQICVNLDSLMLWRQKKRWKWLRHASAPIATCFLEDPVEGSVIAISWISTENPRVQWWF